MLDKATVLGKTDSGRDAIANRTHNLNPRQRALLISINGETDVGALLARFGAGAPDSAMSLIEALVERGLVASLAGADVASAPVQMSRAQPEGMHADAVPDISAPRAQPGPVVESVLASEGQPGMSLPAQADWRDMQRRAGDRLHAAMGADADLLAMRLTRSRSESEFMGHMERAFDLIRGSRGDEAARRFHHEVSGFA